MGNPSLEAHPKLDEWISIETDGRIVVKSGKVDIGQKISTAIAMIAAEELGVDLSRIEVAQPATGDVPNEGVTAGSNSMEMSGHAVRFAAATARRHLLRLAAEQLDIAADDLEVSDGLMRSPETNRTVTYWELFGGKLFGVDVDEGVPLKSPDTYRIVGQPRQSRFTPGLVKGEVTFIHDMAVPGMKHARIVRPPHYGASVSEIDNAIVVRLAGEGLTVVRDGIFLALVGDDEYQVVRGAERLGRAVTWDVGNGLNNTPIFDQLADNERVSLPVRDGLAFEEAVPDLAEPPSEAVQTLAARYEKPYTMHASMGPSAALAEFDGSQLTVWTHSQGIYMLRKAMAGALDLDEGAIKLIHGLGPGCYGHNAADDVALDAALVARQMPNQPVLLKWTREQEHGWEPYGSAMAMDLRASLGADGKVIDWSHETFSDTHNRRPFPGPDMIGTRHLLSAQYMENPIPPKPPTPFLSHHMGIHRNLDPLYTFENRRLVKNLVRDLPLRVSALRTLGAFGNIFALESFMDELAEAAEIDPVTFRLNHLDDERAKAVVEAVGQKMDFGPSDGVSGRGLGFAQYKNTKTYAAVGVELSVNDAAEVRLAKIVIAADAGQVVDPDGLAAQLEGGALQAASWTLHEEVTFDREGITSLDWDTYPILGFDNVPEIDVVLMDRPGDPFLGAGEASSGPTGAAIANAVYNCTGLRLRRMPFTPDQIKAAAMQ